MERLLAARRMIFFDTQKEATSKINHQEASLVAYLITLIVRIYGDKLQPNTVGVITPYRSQIAKIRSLLPEGVSKLVTVDTVERYQGGARQIIIYSIAVNNYQQMQNLQVLTDDRCVDRKLNVAITRAEQHLIIMGCRKVISAKGPGNFYRPLVEHIEKQGYCVTQEQVRKILSSN